MNTNLNFKSKNLSFQRSIVWILGLVLISCWASQVKAAAMSGTYTICTSSCSYSTVGAAINDLNKYGVSGPVRFNIYGGNYNENLTIGNISGASATNTITFNGNGSNAATAGSNGTGPTRVYSSSGDVFYLRSTIYVILQNIIIDQLGSTHSIETSYSQNCRITNCLIRSTSTSVDNIYDIQSFKNIWSGNIIRGGANNVYINQYSTYYYGQNHWSHNKLTQASGCNIHTNGDCQSVFDGNYCDSSLVSNSFAIYDYEGNGNTWQNNIVGSNGISSGILLYFPNVYGSNATIPFNVINNMIGTLSPSYNYNFGIYLYLFSGTSYNYDIHILYNTVNMNGGGGSFYMNGSGSAGCEIVNNSFTNTGGSYAAIIFGGSSDKIDGNNYYSSNYYLIQYNNVAYRDLVSYRSAGKVYGHGVHDNIESTPYKSTTDLHLIQSKPAPIGIRTSITTDIDGDSRCALFPTCGADESNYGKGKMSFSISGNSTAYTGSPTAFLNSASDTDLRTYSWYLDSVSNSTKLSDSIHLVTTALTNGTHYIYLVSNFCTGPETASFKVNVINPTKAPVTNFIASKTIVNIGDPVSLIDVSGNGPTVWVWSISPKTYVDTGGYTQPAFKYLFGSSASSFNPVIQFNALGKYQICLTAFNSLGSGNTVCKSQYIDVVESISLGYKTYSTSSDGLLYGGILTGGSYYSSGNALISPCSDKIYLVINSFNTTCGYDYLRIYDGTNNSGKLLVKKCSYMGFTGSDTSTLCSSGSSLCLPKTVNNYKSGGVIDTFIASSGSMYVEFTTNSNRPGLEAFWWSTPSKVSKPTAKFSCTDSICVNQPLQFTNTSAGANMSFLWDLDGNPSRYEYRKSGNPSFIYRKAGLYRVTLIVRNCGGADTFVKIVKVVNPPKPVITFTTDNSTPTPVDYVFLYSDINQCVDSFSWFISKKYSYKSGTTPKVIYLNSTNNNSSNPVITLPDTGCWDVILIATNVSGSVSKYSGCFFNVKAPYCVPNVVKLVPDIGISKVFLKTIANSSSQGTTAYQDFVSTINTTLELGGNYTLIVNRNSNTNKINRSVYIDWNNDGDFDDSLEHYADDNSSASLSWSVNVKVPSFAAEGASVMRIAVNLDGYSNKPCGVNEFGEYEDYRLYITKDRFKPWINLRGVFDTLAPTDTVHIQKGFTYIEKGADAYDDLSTGLNAKMKVTANPLFNKHKIGTYKITYNVSDDAGNAADPKTRVIIEGPDKSPPILGVSLPNDIYSEVFNTYKRPVFSAIDSNDGDLTSKVIVTNNVDTTKLGVYSITYSVSDSAGNAASAKRLVHVADNTPPSIKLVGNQYDSICRWHNYTDAGYTVSDNYWPDSNIIVAVEGTYQGYDMFLEGTYSLRYRAHDKSGNISYTDFRYVTVMSPDSKACLSSIMPADELARYINIFPNPGTGRFMLSINAQVKEKINISICNMLGQQIAAIENGVLNTNQIELDLSLQPSGIYMVNIRMGNTLVTKRISINK